MMKLAVFGMNHGFKFAEEIKKMKGVSLVAVAGNDLLSQERASLLEVPLYTDYQTLIAENSLDGVIVTLPNQLHHEAVKMCADAGIHCLVEKPIADTVSLGKEMVDYCKEKEIKLLVGHHRRYSSKLNALRRLIQEKKIGKLISVNMMWVLAKDKPYYNEPWRVKKGGGPLLINGIHDIDNLRYVTNAEVESVYALGKNLIRGNNVEDSLSAMMELNNGATVNYFLSDGVPAPWSYELTMKENVKYPKYDEDCYYFFGTEGSIAFPSMRMYRYKEESYGWEHSLVEEAIEFESMVDPIVEELVHFTKVIRGLEEPRVPGEEGVKTLEVIEAIRCSINKGKKVHMNLINETSSSQL
ncbi:Gfo/Idh/MocA family oxidoreductase [Alkalihalobacillus sp. LMS6]|uniref:Gfo/Idh/MocA family protein n=2 Tax=Bacillaceae TaxID=186817 RepID=UPI000C087D63|nr:Gfo/Idh/MocA family oxidoreductase [Alkalihalobacillus sp. LMS6]UTR07239.1 Gfo/Idh/MocA family oxidoreductase [Alkalihalobacillus sp. LMS6]